MPIPGSPVTSTATLSVDNIATRVKRQFGDEAGSQITDADIIRWINDAQRELALNNNLLQIKGTSTLISGTSEYGVPSDILTLHSVKLGGVKLSGLSIQEIDEFVTASATGRPTHYWMWAGAINLYPTPDSSAVSVGSLDIFYTRQPVQVTTGSDIPELPSQYHNRIVEYCIAQAYELDDNMQGYVQKMSMFRDGADRLKDNESWTQRDVYPSISVSIDDTSGEGTTYYAW